MKAQVEFSPMQMKQMTETITKEMSVIQQLKLEVEQMKLHLEQTQCHSNTSSSMYKDNLVQNLELQVESLKEELWAESNLRNRMEEELSRMEDELRIYKLATSSDPNTHKMNDHRFQQEDQLKGLRNSVKENAFFKNGAPTDDGERQMDEFPERDNSKEVNFRHGRPAEEDELKVELAETQLLYDSACQRVKELEGKLSSLEEKYEVACRTVNQTFQKVSDTLELAKTAADERDAALADQANTESELHKLRSVIEKLIEEAGQKTREEVDKVREQANQNITALLEELHMVEKSRSQLAMELEKYKVTSEREIRMNSNIPTNQVDLRFEQTLQRAHQAERERDELKLKLETSESSRERVLAAKQSEIEQLLCEVKLLKERLETSEANQKLNEEMFKRHSESIKEAERHAADARQQSEAAQRSALQQVMHAHQTLELQEAEAKRRIDALENASRLSAKRWQDILTKQQKLTMQWKSEAQLLADQMEQQGNAMRAETEHYKDKVEQLLKKLAQYEASKLKMSSRPGALLLASLLNQMPLEKERYEI
ncbi:hypothetical protein T265_03376 [Opisthorchis viverrini]|uniref:Uncharacterized protein n=1 Tax=Opisthorchis viverrini TaxID=6198 RepID=A0A075A3H8_OPIVI|nr:hypothetical protein T265_03376 [Opisthorchis viverrini]KER30110.1 hypothetical protein T265_03376 [Opisthorchis viverrini]